MPDQDTIETNKRTARRQRVLKQGKILLSNGMSVIDFTMPDMPLMVR